MCPRGTYGFASFSCAQLSLAVGDVVCAVAMWLAVLLVEVLVLCFDPLSCVWKSPAVHFVLFYGLLGVVVLRFCALVLWCIRLWPSW